MKLFAYIMKRGKGAFMEMIKSSLCHWNLRPMLTAGWPLASDLTFLDLSFFICNVGLAHLILMP